MKEKNLGTLKVGFLGNTKFSLRSKLIGILVLVKIIPIILITIIAFQQINAIGQILRKQAVLDSTNALNKRAVENIERMTTDTAKNVAEFLYERDDDILLLSSLIARSAERSDYDGIEEIFDIFSENKLGRIVKPVQEGDWILQHVDEVKIVDGKEVIEKVQHWVRVEESNTADDDIVSSNIENNINDGFNYRKPDHLEYIDIPLYDEITFVDVDGFERAKSISAKVIANNGDIPIEQKYYPKKNFPMNPLPDTRNLKVSDKVNTYIKAEDYFEKISAPNFFTKENKVYVSDVIGAYIGTNYVGMYTPEVVEKARGENAYDNEGTAYAGEENPYGQRFEGIVRFATEVKSGNNTIGYVTFALNHDHIMEFIDRQTPMDERYTELPSAYKGNYAFIWDYKCRSIVHPRHHSIVGYNPNTGDPEVPWLEERIFWDWIYESYNGDGDFTVTKNSLFNEVNEDGVRVYKSKSTPMTKYGQSYALEKSDITYISDVPKVNKTWFEYIDQKVRSGDIVEFGGFKGEQQSRSNSPSADLTRLGFVGLDGRYLNNAPQCIGWMDLTEKGGSGSFYIKWSGLDKLTTAAAIPYYSGQYAPSEQNGGTLRGFGIVTIGAGLDDFTGPAKDMEVILNNEISSNLRSSTLILVLISLVIIALVVLIAIMLASSLTGSITDLIKGFSRFRSGERQFRFATKRKDEFGTLADSFDEMADSLVDSVKHALAITDMNRKIKYMNQYGLDLCQISLSEIVGTDYGASSVYPARSKYCPITALEENRESEIFYVKDRDVYMKGKAGYLVDKDGVRTGYIVESTDMTDIVKRQIKMEEQKVLLDRIFAASPDLIWYKDTEGKYLSVNPRFAAIGGIAIEAYIGKSGEEIFDEANALMLKHDRDALGTTSPIYNEERVAFSDGHEETLESVRTPIIDTAGETIGMLGFARNVSERVRIEKELRKTQLDLEKAVSEANNANKHKGEFLARMSHEIRTPMNAIIGINNIVGKKLTSIEHENKKISDIKINVAQIESSSQHLLGLLNDILDISKIEAGKIELATNEVVELSKLIGVVHDLIAPRCKEKNIAFKVNSDDFSDFNFLCDSLRLKQVLINLLGNAVKFTSECGVVEFTIKKKEVKDGKTLVEFAVHDTGIGISESAKKSIFQAFEQGDNKIPRQYGGTGLGLSISRRIIQLFGGDISVESELGEGSTFSFEIWLKQTNTKVLDESEFVDVDGKYVGRNILLVDDVELNRIIVKSILENTGANIIEADDGLVAVERFKESEEFFYDIVLMDVKMPNMDGHQATAAIRALKRSDATSTPIIALTANAFKEDIDEAIKCGMNAHISKPVEVNALIKVCNRYLLEKQ